jgi:hypothetical protein
MFRFLLGVIVGLILSFLLIYCGGGQTVKKVGEGLTETGKRMERVATGPIPGRTPIKVPIRTPTKQKNRLSGWQALDPIIC